MKHPGRIPSLDGLRGVGVLTVLFTHTMPTHGLNITRKYWQHFDFGNFAVRMFFVMSGYLITYLLLVEYEKYGKISLKEFYLRRTLRIFPAYYVYISTIALLSLLGWVSLQSGDLAHAFTYTADYHYQRSWWLGHVWSLSVEEQFYLLWPGLLVLLGIRRGRWIALGTILLGPVSRIVTWKLFPDQMVGIGESFHTVADSIACGCLLALCRDWLWGQPLYRKLLEHRLFWLLPVALFLANRCRYAIRFDYPIGETFMNVGLALGIDYCMRYPQSRAGRFFNFTPFAYLGTWSYSIYLWQQLFLNKHSTSILCHFPLNIVLAVSAGVLSHYLIEIPFQSLRSKIRWKTATQVPLAPSIAASFRGAGPTAKV